MSFESVLDFGIALLSGLSAVGDFFMRTIDIPAIGEVSVLELFGASLVAVVAYKVVRWFI